MRGPAFWLTTPSAYTTAASRHSATPSTDELPCPDIARPTTTAPENEMPIPSSRRRGSPSPSMRAPIRAIRIGPMFTSIAAVPASTSCSPQLSATM